MSSQNLVSFRIWESNKFSYIVECLSTYFTSSALFEKLMFRTLKSSFGPPIKFSLGLGSKTSALSLLKALLVCLLSVIKDLGVRAVLCEILDLCTIPIGRTDGCYAISRLESAAMK